jgi:pimeloyl-ACP methyl ester carboxylesterase
VLVERRRGARLRRALVAVAVVAAGIVAGVAGAPPADAQSPVPVLVVNGYNGVDAGTAGMAAHLDASIDRVYRMNLVNGGIPAVNGGASNVDSAHAIAARVAAIRAETGAARVDIVGYSQGGLAARYYLKHLGGAAEVRMYVSLGTAHTGTTAAGWWCMGQPGCYEMRPGSPFITDLNSGDPTPGDVIYVAFWSETGDEDTPLPGALVHRSVQSYPGCADYELAHSAELDDPVSRQMVLQALLAQPIAPDCP